MKKIQGAYRLDPVLIREMETVRKRFPKVTNTDIIEAALFHLFNEPGATKDRVISQYVLGDKHKWRSGERLV